MLRIAVPNKGSLSEPAVTMLKEAGYKQRRDSRELVLVDQENNVEFFFLRPRDVAVYVGSGTLDAGITGRDLLIDSGASALEHMPLGFARSTFRYASPAGTMTTISDIAGKKVATSYPLLVKGHLEANNIAPASIVRLDGAVESSIKLGVGEVIADVVETGSTLKAAGLEVFGEPILQSEAVLIVNQNSAELHSGIKTLARRLQGVITARNYVLMDYVVADENLAAAIEITPGFESPTVSPLHEQNWSAVRVMVPNKATNKVMDSLYEVGARAIIVTSIHASRL